MIHSTEYFTPLHFYPQSQHLHLQVIYIMNISESPEVIQHVGTILLANILEIVIMSFLSGLLSMLISW